MRQKKTAEIVDRDRQDEAKGWFITAIVETQQALTALSVGMEPEDVSQSETVLAELISVYRKQEYPLTVVLHAAGMLYAMALRMSLENMATPRITIN